ncbi:MAG TPA: M48 family metalloprotease [Steroidobacteraceae bacterium]|nr:M48 family metalloprotease [Steroidobacteraceae bacterium]
MLELTRAQGLAGALIIFALAVLALSLWAHLRGSRHPGEPVLGAWRLGLSQAAGTYSFWILLGTSAMAYVRGFAALWLVAGFAIGLALHWFFVGPRLRASAQPADPTVPVWLEGPGAHAIVLVILLIALIAELRVAGVILAHGLGSGIPVGVAIAASLAALPALVGGRRAAIDVAVLSALTLVPLAVLLAVPALAFAAAVGEVLQAPELSRGAGAGGFMNAAGALAIGVALAGQPAVLDQFSAARDARAVGRAGWIALIWYAVMLAAMLTFGWAARLLYASLQIPDLALIDATARLAPPALQGLPAFAVCVAVSAAAAYQLLLVASLALRQPLTDAPPNWRSLALIGVTVFVAGVAATVDFGSPRVYVFAVVTLAAVLLPVLLARLLGAQWRAGTVAVVMRAGLVLALILFLAGCGVNPVTGKKELQFVGEGTEIKIGEEQYVPARQTQGGDFVVEPEVTTYVQSVGNRLAQVADRKLPYEFVVLNSSVPNAWALPGGKIAINRGLLTQLNSEAELAAVLGHEIVHSAARHGARSMERGMLLQGAMVALSIGVHDNEYANMIVGGAMLGANLISTKYGREAELESDHYGMNYMKRAGYDPAAAIDLQKTFVKLSEGRRQNWLEGLFASHPPSEERVAKNAETAATLGTGGDYGRERYGQSMASLRKLEPAYKKYDEGVEALRKGNAAAAQSLAQEAIKLEPREAKFHELMGDVELSRKNTQGALPHYQAAIDRNPGYFKPHLQVGIAKFQSGDRAGARAGLERSMQLLPTAPGAYFMGKLAQDAGDLQTAVKYFQMAASSNSEVGKASSRELVRLDLPRNPGNYVRVEPRVDNQGRVWLLVENRTSIGIRGVTIAAGIADETGRNIVQGPVRVSTGSGVIAGGQVAQVQTPLGPVTDSATLSRVRFQVEAAAIAE